MNWRDWNDLVSMGGYGLYVWGSVLTVLAAVASELLLALVRRKALLRRLGSQA